jgi:hypothetical protein
MRAHRVARREMAWVLAWAAFVMALTCLPYLYAVRIADGRTFGGFLWGVDEGNVYLAWMRQAAEGEVFFRNQYSIAPESPHFVNLFFQLGGRLSGLTHVTPKVMFHCLRVVGGVFLLWSLYLLAAEVTKCRVARWSALLLASLGSGLGWLVVLKDGWLGLRPTDVGTQWQVQPEAVTFPSLLLNGLFVAAMALMCQVFLWSLRAFRDDDRKSAVIAGVLLLVLGNIHTYNVFPVHLALSLWLAVGLTRRQLRLGVAARQYATIVLISLPSVAWAIYAAKADPAFMAKGLTPTPAFRFVDYAVGYGLVGVLALVGAWVVLSRRPADALPLPCPAEGPASAGPKYGQATTEGARPAEAGPSGVDLATGGTRAPGLGSALQAASLPICWALANSLVLSIPVSFQRKMIEGLHLPLCLLAGIAVAALAERLTRRQREQGKTRPAAERVALTVAAVVALALPSNALFVADCLTQVKTNNASLVRVLQPPMYLDPGDAAAMRWLAGNASGDDVILSSSFMGSYIPTYCRARPWVGHWAETLALVEDGRYLPPQAPLGTWQRVGRDLGVQQVGFANNLTLGAMVYRLTSGADILRILHEHPVTMVYYGPWEQAMTAGDGESADHPTAQEWTAAADSVLRKVYHAGGVTIYRVPPGAPR